MSSETCFLGWLLICAAVQNGSNLELWVLTFVTDERFLTIPESIITITTSQQSITEDVQNIRNSYNYDQKHGVATYIYIFKIETKLSLRPPAVISREQHLATC